MIRLYIILLLFMLLPIRLILAQTKDKTPQASIFEENSDSITLRPKYDTGFEVGTSFMTNLKGGYGYEHYISPRLSFVPSQSWKFDFNATLTSVNFHNMTLLDFYNTTRGVSGLYHYFGLTAQGTYKLNEKLYLSSAGFAENSPNLWPVSGQSENRINYGGTLLIGYKFSDKFSMHAGFGIQRVNDPWNMNSNGYNRGFMP